MSTSSLILALLAVAAELDCVSERQEIMLTTQPRNCAFELCIDQVYRLFARLTNGVVMVWGKNFTELELALETVPYTVYDAEFLE